MHDKLQEDSPPETVTSNLWDVVNNLVVNPDSTLLIVEHNGTLLIKQLQSEGKRYAVLTFTGKLGTA